MSDQGLAARWRAGISLESWGLFPSSSGFTAQKYHGVTHDTFATKLSRRTIQDTGKATWQIGQATIGSVGFSFPGFQTTLRFLAAFFRKSFYTPGQWCRSEMRDTSRSPSASSGEWETQTENAIQQSYSKTKTIQNSLKFEKQSCSSWHDQISMKNAHCICPSWSRLNSGCGLLFHFLWPSAFPKQTRRK